MDKGKFVVWTKQTWNAGSGRHCGCGWLMALGRVWYGMMRSHGMLEKKEEEGRQCGRGLKFDAGAMRS